MKPDGSSGFPARSLCAVILSAGLASSLAAQTGTPRVVGYYPDWSRGTYPHSLVRYQDLTHIVHAFVIPNADGSLGGTTGFAYPELLQSAHAAGVKVVLGLGGWDQSAGFSPMAANAASRQLFIENVRDFCLANGYDGVDLDWEYPANASDSANFTLLVREMRESFSGLSVPLTISVAVPSTNWSGRWFNVGAMEDAVDWMGIMTYDFFGSWTVTSGPNSALYGSFATNSQGWVDNSWGYYTVTRGIAPDRLLIGIPFYGWVFDAPGMYGASTGAVQQTYATIATYPGQGWVWHWDGEGMVPYMVNASGTKTVSYDDSASVSLKCSYALDRQAGGVMIWAIGHDYSAGDQPLLRAVGVGMGLSTGVRSDDPVPTAVRLAQNYPNPFNPSTTIRYETSAPGHVRLSVHDVVGREVSLLADAWEPAGSHQVEFAAAGLASGMYFYRLSAGTTVLCRTMMLIR
jgi:chitinase